MCKLREIITAPGVFLRAQKKTKKHRRSFLLLSHMFNAQVNKYIQHQISIVKQEKNKQIFEKEREREREKQDKNTRIKHTTL